jgi:hypothetical protein
MNYECGMEQGTTLASPRGTWPLIVRVRNENHMVMSVMNMLHSDGDEVMQTGKWNIYINHIGDRD